MRGLSTEEILDIASSRGVDADRGLSIEGIRKRFIHYKDINENSYFAFQDIAVAAFIAPPIRAYEQAVNRSSVF